LRGTSTFFEHFYHITTQNSEFITQHCLCIAAAGNDRPDFDLVGIGEHFIFRDKVVTSDHQMRLDDEIEFPQHFFAALGPFDFHLAWGMTQLYDHAAMIRLTREGLQTWIEEVLPLSSGAGPSPLESKLRTYACSAHLLKDGVPQGFGRVFG